MVCIIWWRKRLSFYNDGTFSIVPYKPSPTGGYNKFNCASGWVHAIAVLLRRCTVALRHYLLIQAHQIVAFRKVYQRVFE